MRLNNNLRPILIMESQLVEVAVEAVAAVEEDMTFKTMTRIRATQSPIRVKTIHQAMKSKTGVNQK